MNKNGIDMGGNFMLQDTCYIYDTADTNMHEHIVGMLHGLHRMSIWFKYLIGYLKFGSIDFQGQPKYIFLVVMTNSN